MKELTEDYIAKVLPKRPIGANKGTFGKVLIVAGSQNYPGAAYLSSAASYRIGSGLVTLSTTEEVKIIVSKKLPEVTFIPENEIPKRLLEYDVVLIGPGLGQDERAKRLFDLLMQKVNVKMIIDGDGLNILSKIDKWWHILKNDAVLTPHPGEMARLSGLSVKDIQSDRQNIALKFAELWNKVIVLKGANTIIASPTGEIKISPFANPVLSTAGTGDVLSGIIAGLIAQGMENFYAAFAGVYVHGLAGEMLKEKYGKAGGLASELLQLIPKALLYITK